MSYPRYTTDAGLGCYIPFLVLPDQEKLQRIDADQEGVIENKRQLSDGDGPRQQAGTGDQNQDECCGRKVARFPGSDCFEELRNADQHARYGSNPAQDLG
jgi:hypothetical protein